jgi:hypothetical protein
MAAHPHLVEAEVWATEHLDLLKACFERFQSDGEWPTLEELQHHFERAGVDINVSQIAYAIPRPLGFVEQQRLVLLVRGLSYVSAAAPLLDDWCAALRIAYEKWFRDPSDELSRSEILRLLGEDPRRTWLVSLILKRERWPFGSGRGGPEDDWSAEIISDIRIVRDAHSAEEILEARREIEFPPPLESDDVPKEETGLQPRPSEGGGKFSARLKNLWSAIERHPVWAKVVASLIVAAILGLVGYGFHELLEGSSKDSGQTTKQETTEEHVPNPTPASNGPTWKEQAAEGGARTYGNPHSLAKTGPRIEPFQYVIVSCREHAPVMPSVGEGYWYRIHSPPWNDNYYAPSNSFWNGDKPGQDGPEHQTDFSVQPC